MKGESGSTLISSIFTNTINSHGQQDHLPLTFSWILHGDGCRDYHLDLLAIQATSLDIHVHHWSYGRSRTLQRKLQGGQLATCGSSIHLMGSHNPHRCIDRWWYHGLDAQYSQFLRWCDRWSFSSFSSDGYGLRKHWLVDLFVLQ